MRAEGIAEVNEDKGDRRTIRKVVHAPDIIHTINFVPCIFFFTDYSSLLLLYNASLLSVLFLPPFFLFSKTHSESRREPIARSHPGHGRLSKKFIVSKLQCFDNFLPCHAAVSAASRRKHP